MAKEIEGKIYAALGIGRDLVKPIEPPDENQATHLASAKGEVEPVEVGNRAA